MDITRILVAIDSSNARDAAFERALLLARSAAAELYLLYAVPADQPFSFRAAERLDRMADLRRRAEAAGVQAQVVEQHGDAADLISLHAETRGADLIVMGGQARRSWLSWTSVAERVIRSGAVPTLVVGGGEAAATAPFRNVLVGLDLSPASARVLDGAMALTGATAAQLTVMHSVAGLEGSTDLRTPGRWMVPEYRAHVVCDARRELHTMVSTLPPRVRRSIEVATGPAARAIHERAVGLDADLVVVGRSRGFRLLGSTALSVLRKYDRALLVVPETTIGRTRIDQPLAA